MQGDWYLLWEDWWKIIPTYASFHNNTTGKSTWFFCIGPLQVRGYKYA